MTQIMTLTQLLAKAWELFAANVKPILVIALIIYIPANIIAGLLPPQHYSTVAELFGRRMALTLMATVLVSILNLLATMSLAHLVKYAMEGNAVEPSAALGKAFEKMPSGIFTGILCLLGVLGGIVLLVVPGIILAVSWAFAIYAVVLRDKSGRAALRYSSDIVKGRWLKIFWYLICIGLLGALIGWGCMSLAKLFGGGKPVPIALGFVRDFTGTFFTVVMAVFFLNLEETKTQPLAEQPEISVQPAA